jgi:serine/threonine protein kinase
MSTTAEFIGRRVGRFTITSHLASGGMAELFIARQEAVGGFEKDLVLKMLQERYARNGRVVEMFLDEARLAAKLNHQNIVHVYDVDEADGLRYIAMEYIHGQTVTDIVRRSIARGSFLPLEHAIHIVAETAAGLAYAHECRDPEGRPARIVHRDVSPSNILVTYEGLTKIVDFGIARVQDQIREESGMRPGKVSYMSPEQVRGEGADHRSDIFSLGIILYEITVGRRLWRGPPELVMRRIVDELIPPPTYVRRDYPPALELIVMKALERRAADRYQSAGELQHELNEFMEEAGLKSGSRRLSQYMKELFAPDSDDLSSGILPARERADPRTDQAMVDADESEELNFDRRAPLMMRVEARLDDDRLSDRGRAPVPPLQQSEHPAGDRSDADVPKGALPKGPLPKGPPPKGNAPRGNATRAGSAHAGAGEVAGAGVMAPIVEAAGFRSPLGGQDGAVGSGLGTSVAEAGAVAPLEDQRRSRTSIVGVALRWAILLLLAVGVIVVFLATR